MKLYSGGNKQCLVLHYIKTSEFSVQKYFLMLNYFHVTQNIVLTLFPQLRSIPFHKKKLHDFILIVNYINYRELFD